MQEELKCRGVRFLHGVEVTFAAHPDGYVPAYFKHPLYDYVWRNAYKSVAQMNELLSGDVRRAIDEIEQSAKEQEGRD